MLTIDGTVIEGVKHFTRRIIANQGIFKDAVGEGLYPGTINVKIDRSICINEHFRIKDPDPNYPRQILLFEICRINGVWAYRIRPHDIDNGSGGHGDDVIEISCPQKISSIKPGVSVKLEFFRSS